MAMLTPCPSCTRHVKVGPPSCPFCGGQVPTPAPRAVTLPLGRPLSRAALMFAGAAAVSACSSSSTTATGDAAVDTGHGLPAYGGPVDASHADVLGDDASHVDAADTGQGMASYGVFIDATPPPVDASDDGHHPDAGDASDSGQGMALYGGMVIPDAAGQ